MTFDRFAASPTEEALMVARAFHAHAYALDIAKSLAAGRRGDFEVAQAHLARFHGARDEDRRRTLAACAEAERLSRAQTPVPTVARRGDVLR